MALAAPRKGFTPKFMNLGLKEAGMGFYGSISLPTGTALLMGTASPSNAASTAYQAAEQRVIELAPDAEICYFGSSFAHT